MLHASELEDSVIKAKNAEIKRLRTAMKAIDAQSLKVLAQKSKPSEAVTVISSIVANALNEDRSFASQHSQRKVRLDRLRLAS